MWGGERGKKRRGAIGQRTLGPARVSCPCLTQVDVLEYYEDVTVKAPRDEFLVPAVVRVRYFSKRGLKGVRVSLNRHNIFLRDNFQW